MDEYIEIKDEIINRLETKGKYNIKEKIIDAIVYEFYAIKDYYEYKYNRILLNDSLIYYKIMDLSIDITLKNYDIKSIYEDEEDIKIEDDYSEESDAQIIKIPHIIHIEEDEKTYIDEQLEEINSIDYNFIRSISKKEENEYQVKEDISEAFKLLLKKYSNMNNHPLIQQYLELSPEIYTKENIIDMYYLLISTLLFKINLFYKNKLDTVMSSKEQSQEYDGINIEEIIFLDHDNNPINIYGEILGENYFLTIAQNGNDSIFSENSLTFLPEIFCKNIRNAFAHHAWKFSKDGRLYFYHVNQTTGKKDFNIAIDKKNLDATIYAILKTCLKDKYKIYLKYYKDMYDYNGLYEFDFTSQEEIQKVIKLFKETQIISEEEISNMLDEKTSQYDIDKVKEYINEKLENLAFIKTLAEELDDIKYVNQIYTYNFSFYKITESHYETKIPPEIKNKYLSNAMIITILNAFFVHMNLDKTFIRKVDFSSLTPTPEYIKLLEEQRDKQILKHTLIIENAKTDLTTYKNVPKKVENLNKKIERENQHIETIKETFENKKKLKNTESVFNHIRNSIAHGNIEIIDDGNKLVIKDIEPDSNNREITFGATIEINKLLEIILNPLIEKEQEKEHGRPL